MRVAKKILDLDWEIPQRALFFERFSKFCRLIRFDKGGTGFRSSHALEIWPQFLPHIVRSQILVARTFG